MYVLHVYQFINTLHFFNIKYKHILNNIYFLIKRETRCNQKYIKISKARNYMKHTSLYKQ